MKKLSTFLKTLLVAVGIGVGSNAWAQSAYWTEDFEDALGAGWSLSTDSSASLVDNTSSSVDKRLGSKDLRMPKNGSYIITPSLSQGVSTITFWQCRNASRTLTIYTSTDGGTNWTKHSDISASSSAIATVTINNPFVNRIKIANESSSDADLDDLTVYQQRATLWKENFESTTVDALQSAWTHNLYSGESSSDWPGTYGPTFELKENSCGNSSKWFLTRSGSDRQRTAYYYFASAYTGKAYQFDAKLNLNCGLNNSNESESKFYFMNGAKSSKNDDPTNYLFYIGVNTSGYVYISNGTNTDVSEIGGLTDGTNNIAKTLLNSGRHSTGWFDASCIIDLEGGNAKVTVKSGETSKILNVTLKNGTNQLSGISVLDGSKQYGVVAMDDIALYELTYPAFTLSETLKEVAKNGNTTVDVTDLTGTISVTSADESIATASYADGTITINGVALGTTTLTVSCTNDGFTVTKEIAVTVEHGVTYNTPALYSEDFESYDISKETPDNPTAAGWTIYGGSSKIEKNSNASINQCAWFNANNTSGNRGQYYNFASSVVSDAANYWKIEFDAALTAGSDRTESSVAITSANSGDVASNSAASGDLYFLCKQKTDNSNVYEVFLGNSTSEVSATYTLTNGTFYHFIITYNGTTVTAKIGSNAKISKEVNASTVGALKGLKTCESRGSSCIVRIDNITLHNFNAPAFTLAETEKTINQGENGTVSVTGVVGEISVESSNTSVATASYADGTITITGVAGGTANITVNCFNNGVNAPAGTIATTIISYAEQYTTAKAVYDAKVENLDAAGQAYWTSNVTDVASVVDAASCSAAIAALPTTYLAAVKAQEAGSDMTDAMPTGNTGWTVNQGNGPASYGSTGATETYSDGGATYAKFSTGNIMSQTITGLPNGLYKVQFYGVVNAANNVSTVSGADLVQAYANDVNLDIDVVLQNSCTPTDYLRTIQAEVTDGTLTYGLKVKDEVTDAGNWAVAKTFKLTFLGDTKYNYTINAVAGETTIKQLGTGSEYPGLDYGAYVPYVIQYNSKYYVLDDNSTYYKNFTMGAADATKEVSYTLDESIAAFVEGESMTYVGHSYYETLTDRADASNGGAVTVYTASKSGGAKTSQVAGKGIYNISVAFVTWGTNTEDFDLEYSTDGTNYTLIKSFNLTSGPLIISANVELPSASYIRLMNKTEATPRHSIDYVLIRKLNVNDNPVIIGKIDNSTAYCAATSDKKTLKPGESYRYQFVNHNSNGSENRYNWLLPVYNTSDNRVIVVRADNYEDCHHVGETWGSNAGCTSTINWTDFVQNMDGAIVDMTVTFTADKKFNMTSTISPSDGSSNWTYSYTNDYTESSIDLTGNDYIKVALSVNESWLEILSEEQTAVSATLGTNGYGTFASPYPLDLAHLPEGLTAYKASTISGKTVTFTAVAEAVQANTGLLLKGDAGESETIVSIPVAASGADISASNQFLVNTAGTTFTGDDKYYYFGLKKNTLTFGLFDPSKVAIPANKAYLEVLKSSVGDSSVDASRSLSIVFDDEATAVFDLNDKSEMINDKWYDLQGRRVDGSRLTVNGSRLNPGIYIKNGRKVVVK